MTEQSLVILTGAGISAESGLRTFRDADGLWEEHRVEDVATPEAFLRDPGLVYRFYNERRRQLLNVQPNAAHQAIAALEAKWRGNFLLVTQNVDNLHERAGSHDVVHMHGELTKALCQRCGDRHLWTSDLDETHACGTCRSQGVLRPDIVWFGEMPHAMERIMERLATADLFIAIGTSGRVYPAAGFAEQALRAHRIEINLATSDISDIFHERRCGPAGTVVPQLVQEWLRV